MEVSNADRVVFPDDGVTKGEVVAYYQSAADRMLPFIEGRALSVERFPRGIGGQGFMQKNVPDHAPEDLIGRYQVPKEDGGTTVYPVVSSAEGIAFFANLGVITFHVPPVKVDDEAHPDWAIWDLDPPPDRVDLVRTAAEEMRSLLDQYRIPTMLMTSGSKGYHLRAKIQPSLGIETVSLIARGTAALAAAAHDDLLTLAFRKSDRGDRVFVDWMRNTPRSTTVVPWSLRPRPGAPVAVPLEWEELGSVAPDQIRLPEIEQRLGSDPWAKSEPVNLTPVAELVQRSLEDQGIELEPFDRFRS
ncbi:MAG TPA: ATP-dependent DNA ligase [Acidimicrobiia bacterium]|jgi:bifunctional non-homologous end joining protein LigD